ncbi:hypothetical protein ACS0TY_023054 [Phlomoides rotata]
MWDKTHTHSSFILTIIPTEEEVGVAKAINEVIVEERGEGFSRKAREMNEKMKMEEDDAIHEVVEELSRICMTKSGN